MKITKEMEQLKAILGSATEVSQEIRQFHLEKNIFPCIQKNDPFDVNRLCSFFGIETSEYQAWKWLAQMPVDHIKKIRRRVEDRLRKSSPWEILRVAKMLDVSTIAE